MRPTPAHLLAALAIAGACSATPARAQSGGGYDLTRNVIAGGGATFSTEGPYRLGGTIGQVDAADLSRDVYLLRGGFWPAVLPVAAVTPTPTDTRVGTATETATFTATRVASATTTAAATATNTLPIGFTATATASAATPTLAATATRTAATASPTPTATPPTVSPSPTTTVSEVCVGDCNDDRMVIINELVLGVNIALDLQSVDACPAFDPNHSGTVTINELIQGVLNALEGCPPL
jgi:hypothetical protein